MAGSLRPEPNLERDADWKRRFRLPRVLVQFAHGHPGRALVASNQSGTYELYAYDAGTDVLRQATRRPAGTLYGAISPSGGYIYYVDDYKGDETGHVVRVPFEGGDLLDMTPSMPKYTLVEPSISDTDSHLGITLPTPEGHDSYVVEVIGGRPGDPRMINRSKKAAFGPVFSHDGSLSVVISAERFGGLDFTLTSFRTASGEKLLELADESSRVEPAEFSPVPGDPRLLAMSNRSGVMRPLIWDAVKGTRTDLAVDSIEGDLAGVAWSRDAQKILLLQTDRATTRLWLYDVQSSKVTKVPHPDGYVGGGCFEGNDRVLLSWQDSTHPAQILSVRPGSQSGDVRSFLVPKDVPESHPWTSGTFRSSDGQEIQCWYATPEGQGPFPTILETHGGPTSAMFNVFSPRSQIWLDHGFAFASINYRGSTTFGKDFEKKINGDIGHWEVEDMVAGREWLVKRGIALPDKVFLTGWSYGGYLTLQAMGVRPDLWAGGMGGVVVADWVTEYYDEPDAMKGYDVALHGGTPEEKSDEYRKASPINYLEVLAAPLLIVQGKNDVRDPPRQVELYEEKAKSLGKDVTVVWFGTGHAGSGIDVEMAISHHETMLRWIYGVLKREPR